MLEASETIINRRVIILVFMEFIGQRTEKCTGNTVINPLKREHMMPSDTDEEWLVQMW